MTYYARHFPTDAWSAESRRIALNKTTHVDDFTRLLLGRAVEPLPCFARHVTEAVVSNA